MNMNLLNQQCALGQVDEEGLFPHIDQLERAPFVFEVDFGLKVLPTEPGVLIVRGARQYGKSTWLEQSLKETIKKFGPGSAFYLNGDWLLSMEKLEAAIEDLLVSFNKDAPVRRLFIDEITAIPNWEMVVKRLADKGVLQNILLVTTGSNAMDLRRGVEKLPGRKGRLPRTDYLFTAISYKAFHQATHDTLQDKTLVSYLMSGGSPIAGSALAEEGVIPDYVMTLIRDWVEGEFARSGRSRVSLSNILEVLYRFSGNTIGQSKVAREAGLSNNTVAEGYLRILNDLGIIAPSYLWDQHKKIKMLRKPCKVHFTNLLVGMAYYPKQCRSVAAFEKLSEQEQGMWLEWLIAQECLRREAVTGKSILAPQQFWQSKNHEVDFVLSENHFLEVKRGPCSPLEFSWFARQFPGAKLTVINQNRFETDQVKGVTFEDFLFEF